MGRVPITDASDRKRSTIIIFQLITKITISGKKSKCPVPKPVDTRHLNDFYAILTDI